MACSFLPPPVSPHGSRSSRASLGDFNVNAFNHHLSLNKMCNVALRGISEYFIVTDAAQVVYLFDLKKIN